MTALSGIAGTAASTAAPRQTLTEEAVSYAASRGISRATLERLGVASGTVFFPDLSRKAPALFFPYEDGWKARSFPEKSFVSSKGFKLSFWGIREAIGQATVYVVEGEMDRAALVEAGIPAEQVLSVPNGAKERPADEPMEARGYAYVEEALRAGLNRAKRFVWCGDNDGPGRSLRADMVRLLGAARFWFVEWPDGCKDAGDMLRTDGPRALRELVSDGALQWPVDGLFRLSGLPEPPELTLWQPGFSEWENKVLLAPRTLSVVTGHPGHGKTSLMMQVWQQICNRYGVVAAVASFETRAKPHHRRTLRQLVCGRREYALTDEDVKRADAWIEQHFLWLVHPDSRPTLEWALDTAEVAVVRHGARIVQFDPWNRFEATRPPHETETDYIGRCLRTAYSFATDLNCHVQITAHPAKMDAGRKGKAPELEDISGSKNWENMVDQGFVIHRPSFFDGGERKTDVAFYHKKARFEELGYPCKLGMRLDLETGRFRSTDYDEV